MGQKAWDFGVRRAAAGSNQAAHGPPVLIFSKGLR